ncbi:MAG TPA: ion channel [Salinarimonas sp.]|jgi:voltage-gated potassium channel|nr:ion channel [Salinarimonas sp.]
MEQAVETTGGTGLRARLRHLYHGDAPGPRRFRYALVVFDILVIADFLVLAAQPGRFETRMVDLALGVLVMIEFAARLTAEDDRRAYLRSPATLADIAVIVSLLLPAFFDNLGFLRVARAVRVLRSYRLMSDLRRDLPWFRTNEDIVMRATNLLVFVFLVTSVVFVTQNDINPGIKTYLDALYFTITTLTTTGFGDITLVGPGGRLLAVLVMVIGVSLFLRLLQAIFRPPKVRYECEDCGLYLHDVDAVHCKACGKLLHIRNSGET